MTDPASSFEQLVRRHRGEIGAYLRRLLGSESEADDVAQDTWLRAHRAFGRLPADANARAWLSRIATNRALTALRRRRGSAARAAAVDLETLPARGDDLEGRIELRRVAGAVAALPPKQRAALVARRFSGLDYAEIALTLGCSPDAARANVYQAIRRLRGVLERPS